MIPVLKAFLKLCTPLIRTGVCNIPKLLLLASRILTSEPKLKLPLNFKTSPFFKIVPGFIWNVKFEVKYVPSLSPLSKLPVTSFI